MKNEKLLQLRAMQTAGATISEIAKELRLSPEDVESKLIELGHTPNEKVTPKPHGWGKNEEEQEVPPQKSRFLTQEEIDTVLLAYDNGMGVCDIARQIGRAQSSVSRIITKHYVGIKKEKEPAPAPTETSSNDIKTLPTNNYKPSEEVCQALTFIDEAINAIIGIYADYLEESEQKVFVLGESCGKLSCIKKRLGEVR